MMPMLSVLCFALADYDNDCADGGVDDDGNGAYILKTRVLVVQTPQTICNFPQKYCPRTRKLSVSVPES